MADGVRSVGRFGDASGDSAAAVFAGEGVFCVLASGVSAGEGPALDEGITVGAQCRGDADDPVRWGQGERRAFSRLCEEVSYVGKL